MKQSDCKEAVDSQKRTAESIAAQLEAGEPLDAVAVKFAAAVLRGFAKNLKYTQPGKRGRPNKIVPGDIALRYIAERARGDKSDNQIFEDLAGELGVSTEAVRKSMTDTHAAEVRALMVALRVPTNSEK